MSQPGPERVERAQAFGGQVETWTHRSEACSCDMRFAVFVPPQAAAGPVPVVYWLSGLTCTEENFTLKAGAQRYAAELGLMLVAPDTSPRGDDVPDDPEGAYDLGLGAGFYVDATEEPWSRHYKMYSYVTRELIEVVEANFRAAPGLRGISGHSMGGHGALVCGLRNPHLYLSISAFAPICAPTHCPWGEKAFASYLGKDRSAWSDWDACELLARAPQQTPIKVDQGDADSFLAEQLQPERLVEAARRRDWPLEYALRPGYDHSYWFIASFIGEHLAWHAERLR